MERPNILNEEERIKLKMLAQNSSSNIRGFIRDEIARVELETSTVETEVTTDETTKIQPKTINIKDEEIEL